MKHKHIVWCCILGLLLPLVLVQNHRFEHAGDYQHLIAKPKKECTEHDDTVFCTHLPLLRITTDGPIPSPFYEDEQGAPLKRENGRTFFNDEMVGATVEYFDHETENNHLSDVPVFRERAMTRIRGNSSRNFMKKSFLLKFKQENMVDALDVSLCSLAPDSSWVLNGPFMDRTLLRNYLYYNISAEITGYAPRVRFCEMFLNDEYMGIYLIVEKIDYNKAGRLNLTPTDPKMADTSYILKLDAAETDDLHRLYTFMDISRNRGYDNRRYEWFEIIYPSKTLTVEQKGKITNDISKFEKTLCSFDSADKKEGYRKYIDVNSFVDFYILNEFGMNSDAPRLSTYFYKDIRGKIHIVGWDYNNIFNNFYADLANDNGEYGMYVNNSWFGWLLRDRDFVDRVVNRYYELRKGPLSDRYLNQRIDETVCYLGDAIDRNYERWAGCFPEDIEAIDPILRVKWGFLNPISRNPESYEESVAALKDMIHERGEFLDENIEKLYSRCHKSATKKYKLQDGK